MNTTAILSLYMPQKAAPHIAKWIDYFQCEFKISKKRQTKLGDYRHPFKGNGHKISVNGDLNPYAFLVTTVHEFAHLLTYNEHKNKVKPHGQEWKQNFQRMMQPFFKDQVFPNGIEAVIKQYLNNPAASSCSDLTLARALRQYDVKLGASYEAGTEVNLEVTNHSRGSLHSSTTASASGGGISPSFNNAPEYTVEEIPQGSKFIFKENRIFQKGEKLRKRYRCTCLQTGKVYLFYPLAPVKIYT